MILSWPENPRLYVILLWVGTFLAGSIGIVWFGYWTATRIFGGGLVGRERHDESLWHQLHQDNTDVNDEIRKWRLRAWLRVMSGAATVGVVGGFVVISSFMILGAELLAPAGTDVAVDLTRLFSGICGLPGKVILLTAIIIALGGSILANQDGWGRSFADMTLILIRDKRQAAQPGRVVSGLKKLERLTERAAFNRRFLKQLYIFSITGILPIIIILLFRDPVEIMSASGIIAAAHTPFIVLISLYVNRTRLPDALRPGIFNSLMMATAGMFYLIFALFYLRELAA